MADDNPLELFRHALAGATRAIAGDAEVEVSLTSDAPSASGKSVKAPMPGRTLGAREAAEARGFADAAALRLRHHNERLHQRHSPADDVALSVFDALDTDFELRIASELAMRSGELSGRDAADRAVRSDLVVVAAPA